MNTLNHYVTKFATDNGGVAFLVKTASTSERLGTQTKTANGTTLADSDKIVVLPEALAKTVDVGTSDVEGIANKDKAGTVYTVKFTPEKAMTDATIHTISIGGVTLKVGADGVISGEILYSATTGTTPVNSTHDISTAAGQTALNPQFLTFTLGKYAKLGIKNNAVSARSFASGGDVNGDGEADAYNASNNMQFIFVRDTDNKVKVYLAQQKDNFFDPDQVNSTIALTAYSEEGVINDVPAATASTSTYTFDLTYADPNSDATINSFKLGNTSGSINGRTINVTMPFGTDLTALVPTFSTSTGAKVALAGGSKVESGKTVLNFTSDVTLYVTSEDGSKTLDYKVHVTVAEQFKDVQPGDWFYDNVMRAVELGILSGKGEGIFAPNESITRRDFAIMLAGALGQSNEGTAVSPFKDVADDDYGVVSIAYLYNEGISVGDDKGNFNPSANITRQEAAAMLVKAFEATGTSTELYTDDARIADWAKSFVYTAKASGLMSGDVAGTFRPTSTLTRAEAASAMVNAVDN